MIQSDAGHAVKLLLKRKGFTTAVLLTLVVCIGANTAVFSVVNSVLLKPLPFEGADRLVAIYNSYPRAGVERGGAAAPDYYDRRELPALEHVAMFQTRGVTVGEAGSPERVTGLAVTPSFFRMLGVRAANGRTFVEEEGEPGNDRRAVLSWGLWHERYGGAPDAVGRTIRIDDVEHTIVGVMPRDFVFRDPAIRVWVPLAFGPELRTDEARHSNNWNMIARLRPGVTLEQAQQQLDALNARIVERLPHFADLMEQVGFRTLVADYRSELTRDVRGTLWLLQGGVLLVLLIGCVNIANLVLVRATARQRELATRAALGAARTRLVRQLLTESLVLALAGGALGVLVGWGAVRAFGTLAAETLPRGTEIGLDATTLVVAFLASLAAGLVFSALPAVRLLRVDLSGIFREEGRSGTAGRATVAWRGALVTAQVALAFTLLVGAGLVITSFARTLAVDPGFEPRDVLAAAVSLPVTRYPDQDARRRFSERLLERVRALPGVTAAAVTNILPFGQDVNASAVTPEGQVRRDEDALVAPVNSRVTAGYFETMGIEVLAGRAFQPSDDATAPPVAIVDRYLAERFWPGEDPIGRRAAPGVQLPGEPELSYRTIVGVVENVRVQGLTGDQPLGHFYVPAAQLPAAQAYVVVKTAGPPDALAGGLRRAVVELDPELPIHDVRTMEARLAESLATERLRMLLLTAFGALALFLAALGLYGVLAYSVAQRRAEVGIRMALGSTPGAVFRLIMGQGARMVGVGLAVGILATLGLGRVVQGMLFGVEPGDPLVLGAVLALLAATAFAACLVPTRRAMRVDPAVAIRDGG